MPFEARRDGEGVGRGGMKTGDKKREKKATWACHGKRPSLLFLYCYHTVE